MREIGGGRRRLLRLLAALPLLGSLLAIPHDEEAAAKKKKKKRKKKCAKAGQAISKKRKTCCAGLVKDVAGLCAPPTCVPSSCPPTACGSMPDGCGGTLACSCQANHFCLDGGVCQPCTVTCTGSATQCGSALQQALDGGGTVYVCPGRYIGNFTVSTAVRVVGAGEGADITGNTILDVGGSGRTLVIKSGVGLVELERLRITDSNSAVARGGIDHAGAALRMTECTVVGNTSLGFGGGISASGTLEMTRCTVRDNHTFGMDSHGGGIAAGGPTTLTDCLIEGNDAGGQGGGLYLAGARTTLLGTTQVRGNTAQAGGGIFVDAATLVIAESCRVMENTAPMNQGGGINSNAGAISLQGANPSPIVVNNCFENCAGIVPKCAATPVSCGG